MLRAVPDKRISLSKAIVIGDNDDNDGAQEVAVGLPPPNTQPYAHTVQRQQHILCHDDPNCTAIYNGRILEDPSAINDVIASWLGISMSLI